MLNAPFSAFILLLLSQVCSSLGSGGCTLSKGLTDPTKIELLNRISILNSQKFICEVDGYSFAVSICDDVSKADKSFASVTRLRAPSKATPLVLGRYNNTDIITSGGEWLMLIYSGGDIIIENGTCNGSEWKTIIYMTCNTDPDDFTFDLIAERTGGCFAMFQLKSRLLCPMNPVSKTTVIFALLTISLICYLVIGIAYRRFMTGAKGIEQIPNYEFWRALFVAPYRIITRGRASQDEWRRGETGDEPLLSP